MVGEYPERINGPGEYSDWVALLAQNALDILRETSENLSEISEDAIGSAVRQETEAKIEALGDTHTPKDILRLSETLQRTFIQGRMRMAEDTDEVAVEMARKALFESVREEVEFQIEQRKD